MSSDRGMDKQVLIDIYNENREWNNDIYSNMDGPRDY